MPAPVDVARMVRRAGFLLACCFSTSTLIHARDAKAEQFSFPVHHLRSIRFRREEVMKSICARNELRSCRPVTQNIGFGIEKNEEELGCPRIDDQPAPHRRFVVAADVLE